MCKPMDYPATRGWHFTNPKLGVLEKCRTRSSVKCSLQSEFQLAQLNANGKASLSDHLKQKWRLAMSQVP
jgi:hypothetical protein